MAWKLGIVGALALAAAGCTMQEPEAASMKLAADANVEQQIWRGPDGCFYDITLVNGTRTGMERRGAGNGDCFK